MGASRRWILGVLAVGSAAAAVAGPSGDGVGSASAGPTAGAAACGGVQRFAPGRRAVPGRAPLAIGDSVLLGAAAAVAARGYAVDVRGCRQMSEGLALLRARRRAGSLPPFVAIVLGTNGPVTRGDVGAALRILGPERLLGLVTPRELGGGSGSDAATLRAIARERPRRTLLLDWVALAARRPGLTYGDGIHLAPAGQRAMAKLMADGLERAYPPADRWRQVRTRPVAGAARR
jgi:hypothetical protein